MNRTRFQTVCLFCSLTLGFAIVHALASAWIIGLWQVIVPNSHVFEYLQITEDGEPLIGSWTAGDQVRSFRKLDGSVVANDSEILQSSAALADFSRPVTQMQMDWSQRIKGFQDYTSEASFWYFVAPPDRPGMACFEGFDRLTRRRIGYLGRNGFSLVRPTLDQYFPIGTGPISRVITSSQRSWAGAVEPDYYGSYGAENAAADAVWLLSEDQIYELRLRSRQVRVLYQGAKPLRHLAQLFQARDGKYTLKLAIRTDTEFLLLDPKSSDVELLPSELPAIGTQEYLYLTSNGDWIRLTSTMALIHEIRQSHVAWYDNQGILKREEDVTLHQSQRRNGDPALYCPIPVAAWLFCGVGGWLAPGLMPEGLSPLQQILEICSVHWLWLLTSTVIGIVAAWDCRRRERIWGCAGWGWPIAVGILGWFGWVGYVCLRPLPQRLPGGQWMIHPPEPNRPLGIEIFG